MVASSATASAMPDADALDRDRVGEGERGEDRDHDQRRAGDHAGRPGQAVGDGRRVVTRAPVRLLDARQEQDLVVHRQPDQDREHDDRVARDGVAERLEVQQLVEVALLEDPDQGAEARREREQRHHDGLDRDGERAEQQEQDDRGGEQRRPDGPRDPLRLAQQEVLAERRGAADLHPADAPGPAGQPADARDHRRARRARTT